MRNRIVDLRTVKASALLADERNWRLHSQAQREALQTMLDTIGVVNAVIARETPDGLVLIDGHLRADMDPNAELPVLIVDLDDEEAGQALASLDPLAAMAQADSVQLDDLIGSLKDIDGKTLETLRSMNESNLPVEAQTEELQTASDRYWITVSVPDARRAELDAAIENLSVSVEGVDVDRKKPTGQSSRKGKRVNTNYIAKDNNRLGFTAKLALRSWLAEMFPPAPRVLVAYPGSGKVNRAYPQGTKFISGDGFDQLRRLYPWPEVDIYDVDPWGSPWDVVDLICQRHEQGRPLGLVYTDDTIVKSRFGAPRQSEQHNEIHDPIPTVNRPIGVSVHDWFMSKVDQGDGTGCWLWTGAVNRSSGNYGVFYDGTQKRKIRAHHFLVPPLVKGSGMEYDHLCEKRLCVRPDHLEMVTHKENLRRTRGKPMGPWLPKELEQLAGISAFDGCTTNKNRRAIHGQAVRGVSLRLGMAIRSARIGLINTMTYGAAMFEGDPA